MNKKLVKNQQELLDLFKEWELQDIEEFLGIEFAYVDGTFQSDFTFDGTKEDNEDQDVSDTIFRVVDSDQMPKEYPCIVLYANEKSFDRTGDVVFKFLQYVYLSDFEK